MATAGILSVSPHDPVAAPLLQFPEPKINREILVEYPKRESWIGAQFHQ